MLDAHHESPPTAEVAGTEDHSSAAHDTAARLDAARLLGLARDRERAARGGDPRARAEGGGVIESQSRSPLPAFPQVMPNRVHRLVWIKGADRSRSALIDDPPERSAAKGPAGAIKAEHWTQVGILALLSHGKVEF